MFGHRHTGVARIPGEVPTSGPNDKASGVRMSVATGQAPVREKLELGSCGVTLRWPGLERKGRSVITPSGAPEYDVVIREVMPSHLPVDRRGLDRRVVPDECPNLFGVHLAL